MAMEFYWAQLEIATNFENVENYINENSFSSEFIDITILCSWYSC